MSAERKIQTVEGAIAEAEAPQEPFVLRQQVAERLAAHRSRRPQTVESEQPSSEGRSRGRNSKIAAAVAERYAHSKSYRDFLAEEAERTVREAEEAARQAEAAAAIAARNAEAVAQAQFNLLAELDQYADETHPAPSLSRPSRQEGPRPVPQEDLTPELNFDVPAIPVPPVFTVRLANDLHLPASDAVKPVFRAHRAEEVLENDTVLADPSEFLSLDEEIAFRQDPTFDPIEPPVEIPGNLIEFPRQLVAPRKARPRLAEGPLREEIESSSLSQLRIFEVEAEQISQEPVAENSAPEWTSILLDAQPRSLATESAAAEIAFYAPVTEPYAAQHLQYSEETQHLYTTPLAVAPLDLRLMSAMVDGCIILAASVVFAAVAVLTATRLSPGPLHMPLTNAAISSVGAIVLLGFFYQMLFFTFSNSTPGMRYAHIGLCTFSDENPSRAAMRRRILSLALSSASLGLGVLWALLDEERLGWHDRISRMYQRSY
ncbi:RDD family protein [Edaphobacter albus]|uniref:RDD family protein n=1 Tax=Edaphobacter sp. 4G125 TaxID=2763071 RepID=UPI0016477CB4|nr:RDD family protein [Edaphobacter sp. 4G125]QNI37386.1 RDD family protein [Edaphobacter sp. 4G125]